MRSHPLYTKRRIFAPGLTPVPEEVLGVLARSPLHHRTKEFGVVLKRVRENLQHLYQTKSEAYVLSSSGTGAMEAALVNCLSAGDSVLVLQIGKFGERWTKMPKALGFKTSVLEFENGRSADCAKVKQFLSSQSDVKAVLFQASETSTAVENDVKALSETIHAASDALVIVDAITALGVIPLPMDEWHLDAVAGGSQKALMLPPGLAFLGLSERARSTRKNAGLPRFYFDLNAEDKALVGNETAWTPAVSLIAGLDDVLARFRSMGHDAVFSYHKNLAHAVRKGLQALNLELFAQENPSTAVTAAKVPASIPEGKKIVSTLRDQFGITIAGGQGDLTGKIFRIGHLGFYDQLDMLTILAALEMTLSQLGHRVELGRGVAAASAVFLEQKT